MALAMIAPTAAIAIIPQLIVPLAGTAAPLAFVIAAIAVGIVAVSFVSFGRRIATAGSVTAFVGEAFGPFVGFGAGWTLTFNYLVLVPGSAAGVAYFTLLTVGIAHPRLLVWGPIALGALVISVFASSRDISAVTRIALVLELASTVAIALLALVITLHAPLTSLAFVPSTSKGLSGLGAGIVLAITSFVGFEGAATLGKEARAPFRAIPLAVMASIGVTALFFVLTCYAEVAAFGADHVDVLSNANGPLAILADRFVGRGAGILVNIACVLSSLSVMLALTSVASRMTYTVVTAMRVPWLAHLSQQHGVPARAGLVVGLIGVVIGAGIICLAPTIGPLDMFGTTATIGTLAVILVYMAVTIGGMLDAARRHRPLASVLGLAGAVLLTWPLWSSIYPTPPWPGNLFAPGIVVWLLVGCSLYLRRTKKSCKRVRHHGQCDESTVEREGHD